jgi:hypothetical protein
VVKTRLMIERSRATHFILPKVMRFASLNYCTVRVSVLVEMVAPEVPVIVTA